LPAIRTAALSRPDRGKNIIPLSEGAGSIILGSVDLVGEIRERLIKTKKPNRDLPALKDILRIGPLDSTF